MPIPLPQISPWADLAAGVAVAVGGYTVQELMIRRRMLRNHGMALRRERRQAERATEWKGANLGQVAEDLATAIDVMVAFVDGPTRLTRARSCARQVEALVPAEQRGGLTVKFLEMVNADATAEDMSAMAEEVCVQMAVELRALLARIAAARELTPEAATPVKPRAAQVEEEVEEDEDARRAREQRERQELAAAQQPRWARATAELERLSSEYEGSLIATGEQAEQAAPAAPDLVAPRRRTPRKPAARKPATAGRSAAKKRTAAGTAAGAEPTGSEKPAAERRSVAEKKPAARTRAKPGATKPRATPRRRPTVKEDLAAAVIGVPVQIGDEPNLNPGREEA
jgi:hypothetical protein